MGWSVESTEIKLVECVRKVGDEITLVRKTVRAITAGGPVITRGSVYGATFAMDNRPRADWSSAARGCTSRFPF